MANLKLVRPPGSNRPMRINNNKHNWVHPNGTRQSYFSLPSMPPRLPMRHRVANDGTEQAYLDWLEQSEWMIRAYKIQTFAEPIVLEGRFERINDDSQLAEKIMAIFDLVTGIGIVKPGHVLQLQARWFQKPGCKISINPATRNLLEKSGLAPKPTV